MAGMRSEYGSWLPELSEDWGRRGSALRKRLESDRASQAMLVAGLVAIGLVAWGAYIFGPELRRYMKIRSM